MSTVVVAKKGGKVCIAADSLTSFGDLRMGMKVPKASVVDDQRQCHSHHATVVIDADLSVGETIQHQG